MNSWFLNGGKLDRMNRERLSPLDVAMIEGKTEAMEICLARIQKPNRKLPYHVQKEV